MLQDSAHDRVEADAAALLAVYADGGDVRQFLGQLPLYDTADACTNLCDAPDRYQAAAAEIAAGRVNTSAALEAGRK